MAGCFAMKDGKQWYFMEKNTGAWKSDATRYYRQKIWKVSHESEVFLDMANIGEIISNKLSGLADDCMTYLHKDIRRNPVSVLPGIHYFMEAFWWIEQHRNADSESLRCRRMLCPAIMGASKCKEILC